MGVRVGLSRENFRCFYKAKFSLAQHTGLCILSTTVKLGGWSPWFYCLNQDRVIIISTLESKKATASAHHVLCKNPCWLRDNLFCCASSLPPAPTGTGSSPFHSVSSLFVCVTVWFAGESRPPPLSAWLCLGPLQAPACMTCLWLRPAGHERDATSSSTLTSLLLCR